MTNGDVVSAILSGLLIGAAWTTVKHIREIARLHADGRRLREHNLQQAADLLERENRLASLRSADSLLLHERNHAMRDLEEERRLHHRTNLERLDLKARAEHAEGIARGQAAHIAQLQGSNEKLLETVTDMRRVGFELPHPALATDTGPDVVMTVADDDLAVLRDHPELAAGPE